MLTEMLPFTLTLDSVAIASVSLWSLALYIGFAPVSDWVITQLTRWFNFAERSLYTSQAEYDRTQQSREALNAFYASICSIVPFLALGWLCHSGVALSLGRSWTISLGLLACVGCGIYELGRRDGQHSK
jgi:hypothetical protein